MKREEKSTTFVCSRLSHSIYLSSFFNLNQLTQHQLTEPTCHHKANKTTKEIKIDAQKGNDDDIQSAVFLNS